MSFDGQVAQNSDLNLSYHFDTVADTFYSVLQINKNKTDGTKQYPFVRYVGGDNLMSPKTLRQTEKWDIITNCGWYSLEIENSVVKRDYGRDPQDGICALTIDSNGDLGYVVNWETGDGESLVNSGIVSATTAFFPLVVDYELYDFQIPPEDQANLNWMHAPRQIIGQYGNGDYVIITCEGRGYQNSVGFEPSREAAICQDMGLKFAYNLDGGGSTQTMIGDKLLNSLYEGEEANGRPVPAFIVFNGTDTFSIP